MLKDAALAWADALESGKYKQGAGALCTVESDGTKKYCCLGVLMDLRGAIEYCDIEKDNGTHVIEFRYHTSGHTDIDTSTLASRLVKELEMQDSNPNVPQTGVIGELVAEGVVSHDDADFASLASLNDAGVNFKSIARIIRADYASL